MAARGMVMGRPEPKSDEINALVDRARQKDARAFNELVRRYRPRIYALALHVTGSESDADDIAQDVFIRAYKALDSFEGRGEFFRWLYRIALHLAFTLRRARARRNGPPLDDPRVEFGVAVDANGDPRKAAALRQLYRRLVGALDQLSPPIRATVILVCLQGFSYVEAAEILGTNDGTIAWRIHAARDKLRDAMKAAPRRVGPPPPPPPRRPRRGTDEYDAVEPSPPPRREDSDMFDLSSLSCWYN